MKLNSGSSVGVVVTVGSGVGEAVRVCEGTGVRVPVGAAEGVWVRAKGLLGKQAARVKTSRNKTVRRFILVSV